MRNNIIKFLFLYGTLSFGVLLGQSIEQSKENYKTAVRMKLKIDDNPLFYMNEPKSAQLSKVFNECETYIFLDENGYKRQLNKKLVDITNEVKTYTNTSYRPKASNKIRSNVRYNYFSLKSDID